MNDKILLMPYEEPRLQAYYEGDLDVLADLGMPDGAVHLAQQHRAMLLDCTEKLPVTLMVFPESEALLLRCFFRYTDRRFTRLFMEFRILDCPGELQEESIRLLSESSDPAKGQRVARELYQAYLQVEGALLRLAPPDALSQPDPDQGLLLNRDLDSCRLLSFSELPPLLCLDGRGLLTKQIKAKPYFPHLCVLPEGTKDLKGGRTLSQISNFNGDRAACVRFPASFSSVRAGELFSDFTLEYQVDAQNPKFYAEDGVLYERGEAGAILRKCPQAKTGSLTVPEGVVELGDCAMAKTRLESISLPQSLQRIGKDAFRDSSLSRVPVPAGVTELSWDAGRIYDVAPENPVYFSTDGLLCRREEGGVRLLCCFSGKTGAVTVPEGVTEIATRCFEERAVDSISLPASLKTVGNFAFLRCAAPELLLPAGLEQIGENAFIDHWGSYGKKPFRLTSIRVSPENPRFFDADGVLYERRGAEQILVCYPPARARQAEYAVLPGTTLIGKDAFHSSSVPKRVLIPKDCAVSNEALGDGYYANLQGAAVFPPDCVETRVKLPPYCTSYVTGPRAAAFALMFQSGKGWEQAVKKALDRNPAGADEALSTAISLLREEFSEAAAKKAVLMALERSRDVQPKTFRAFYALLFEKQPKCLRLLLEDLQAQQILLGEGQEEDLHPMEKLVREHWSASSVTAELKSLVSRGLPYREGGQLSSPEAVIFVIDAYARQYTLPRMLSEYESDYVAARIDPTADTVAAALESEPLRALLEQLAFEKRYEKSGYLLAFGRYADEGQIRSLIAKMKEWGKWWGSAATGRRLVIQGRGALMLSDTKPAMSELDRSGVLGDYAALRGTDADTLRDTVLSDFGFDPDGKKRYDLGGKTLAVGIEKDLSLTMLDESTGKIVKSVPRKGADEEKYEAAKAAVSELKKSIRLVLGNRRRKLFELFLSGEEQSAERWSRVYLGNPVLGSLARITVWQQAGRSFLPGEEGLIDEDGQPYALGDGPVRVAHPMELGPAATEKWQHYFLARGLKQPFLQIWEPAYEPSQIREDRYEGCELSVYKFSGREKDGIGSYGLTDYSEDYGFTLTDCSLEAENSVWRFIHGITDDATYKLGKFHIKEFSRVCNHIIFLLDKWTVEDRVAKDDADLKTLLSAFTAAQISDLLALAQEKNSVKALAQLLNEKNERFGTVDLDAEFTLD